MDERKRAFRVAELALEFDEFRYGQWYFDEMQIVNTILRQGARFIISDLRYMILHDSIFEDSKNKEKQQYFLDELEKLANMDWRR